VHTKAFFAWKISFRFTVHACVWFRLLPQEKYAFPFRCADCRETRKNTTAVCAGSFRCADCRETCKNTTAVCAGSFRCADCRETCKNTAAVCAGSFRCADCRETRKNTTAVCAGPFRRISPKYEVNLDVISFSPRADLTKLPVSLRNCVEICTQFYSNIELGGGNSFTSLIKVRLSLRLFSRRLRLPDSVLWRVEFGENLTKGSIADFMSRTCERRSIISTTKLFYFVRKAKKGKPSVTELKCADVRSRVTEVFDQHLTGCEASWIVRGGHSKHDYTGHILYICCTYSVHTLYTVFIYCKHTVHTLFMYGTYTIRILYI
jgi:hypothetical protein